MKKHDWFITILTILSPIIISFASIFSKYEIIDPTQCIQYFYLWLWITTIISIHTNTKKIVPIHTLLFYALLFISYALFGYILHQRIYKEFYFQWIIFTLFMALISYPIWYATNKKMIGNLISTILLTIFTYFTMTNPSIIPFILYATLIICLYKNKTETLIVVVLSIIFAYFLKNLDFFNILLAKLSNP